MSSLETIVRSAPVSPAVLFRERPYAGVEKQAFIRDVLGLANAFVDGSRYLILGVKDLGPEGRRFTGVSNEEVEVAKRLYPELVERYVEPALKFRLDVLELDSSAVAVLSFDACDEPPYLIRENLSNAMREGSGWILKAESPARLRRADLKQLFEKTLLGAMQQPKIRIGFEGKGLIDELALAVLDLDAKPSEIAEEKFRNLMEARRATQAVGSRTTTHIERLVHMREFGGTQPFEKVSETSLKRRLETTAGEHHEGDDFYEFETRTHKVNLSISNLGEVPLRDGLLLIELPRVEGFGVTAHLRRAADHDGDTEQDYPSVDIGESRIRVQANIADVSGGSTVAAFTEPLRVWVRAAAAGLTLPLDYSLDGAGLREPVTGTLTIHCR